MPAKSQAQRGLIFARRDQYGSKKNTPKKWKWIWDEDWENKGKLPKKVKKKKKKVNEAYEIPLEKYIQDLYVALEDHGMDEFEIDAALNDPDNMDIVEAGAADGLAVEETVSRLDLFTPVMGYHQGAKAHSIPENFVSESVEPFVNEMYPETQSTYILFDQIVDELMRRGYTYQEADFAVDQVADRMEAWAEGGSDIQEIGDYIDEKVFGIT